MTTKTNLKLFESQSRIKLMLQSLGIDPLSFYTFAEWALSAQMVSSLARLNELEPSLFSKEDGLRQFRNVLRKRTLRNWSEHDLYLIFNAVKSQKREHYREPISYGEYLKLLWTMPHECAKCKKTPPGVTLHIDHVVPASLGGPSKRSNLQFLCATCNLKKSDKLEGGAPWLDLR
jgi:5-methylcytosine-specific restriction endonuclease McrA